MFHHSKRSNLMFLILALLAFFVLLLVGVLIYKVSSKSPDLEPQSPLTDTITNSVEVENTTSGQIELDQEKMHQEYQDAVLALDAQVSASSESSEVLLSQVEDGLLAIRVPQDKQEAHLQAVLSIVRLRVSNAETLAYVQEEVRKILSSLISK